MNEWPFVLMAFAFYGMVGMLTAATIAAVFVWQYARWLSWSRFLSYLVVIGVAAALPIAAAAYWLTSREMLIVGMMSLILVLLICFVIFVPSDRPWIGWRCGIAGAICCVIMIVVLATANPDALAAALVGGAGALAVGGARR